MRKWTMRMIAIGQRFRDAVKLLLARRHYILVRYRDQHRAGWMDRVTAISAERTLLLNHCEACQLIGALKSSEKVSGDIAEVGVAYGASAKVIAEYASGRPLHLFDTFDGLPAPTSADSSKFFTGEFQSSLESVRSYLGGAQVHLYQGLFPATAEPVKNKVFAFVHLDVDLYESTLACLRFFYPRLSPGGILISHDYLTSEGVNLAFKVFFADKPEPVIELIGYQCMVVKLGGSEATGAAS
jgi:O-methyltransferase